jgi:AcrR family transcriptional regulator
METDERREQLVRLGIALFSERAYDEISIDEIAASAEISKGLLYHYFPSKRHFYVAVVRTAAEDMQHVTEPAPTQSGPEALLAGLDAYLDYVEHHAKGYATLMRGGLGSDQEALAIIDETREAIMRRIFAESAGGEPPEPVRVAVRGWIGFVEATSLDWLDTRGLTREQLRDLLAAALGGALQAARATRR